MSVAKPLLHLLIERRRFFPQAWRAFVYTLKHPRGDEFDRAWRISRGACADCDGTGYQRSPLHDCPTCKCTGRAAIAKATGSAA